MAFLKDFRHRARTAWRTFRGESLTEATQLGEPGWISLSTLVDFEDFDDFERDQLVERSVEGYRQGEPLATGIINTTANHVVSGRTEIRFDDEKNQRIWDRFEIDNHFQRKVHQWEIKRYLEGQAVLRFFGPPADQNNGVPPSMRLVPHEWIRDIETNPEDFEDLRAVHLKTPKNDEPKRETNVLQLKNDPLGSSKEGWPLLAPILADLAKFDKLLQTRLLMNVIRASVPLILKAPEHSPSELTETLKAIGLDKGKMPKPGSFYAFSGDENLEMQFPDLNINASDTSEDFDQWLQRIASAMQVELRVIKMLFDASRVTQGIDPNSPMMKNFKLKRELLKEDLKRVVRRVMGDVEFEVQLAPLVEGNLQSDAQALGNMVNMKSISPQSAAERLGFNWDKEQQLIRQAVEFFRANGLDFKDTGNKPAEIEDVSESWIREVVAGEVEKQADYFLKEISS